MADDDQLLDFRRPGGDQRLQRLGEGAAVDRDVQAGIVGEIDWRIAEVAGERRAVIVVLARPLQVAHAEAVQEDGELARRLGERLGERSPVKRQRAPLAAEAQGQRQRIAGLGQVVADDAVEHGKRDFPPARDRLIVRVRADQRRNAAEPLTGQAERAAHPAVDQPRHTAGQPLRQRRQSRRVEDGRVHMLDNAGEAVRRVGGKAAEAEDVRKREGGGLGGHGDSLGVRGERLRGISRILSRPLGTRPVAHGAMPAPGNAFDAISARSAIKAPSDRIPADRTTWVRIALLQTVLYGSTITPIAERQYSSVWICGTID